jgi:hypothetical protein
LLLKSREFTRWFLLWFLSCFCSKYFLLFIAVQPGLI